jgi:hypothetical protein
MQSDGALCLGDPQRTVDEVPYLLRVGNHVHVLVCDVLEERQQVDFLLVVATSAARACWPTIATIGWWSSLAS